MLADEFLPDCTHGKFNEFSRRTRALGTGLSTIGQVVEKAFRIEIFCIFAFAGWIVGLIAQHYIHALIPLVQVVRWRLGDLSDEIETI